MGSGSSSRKGMMPEIRYSRTMEPIVTWRPRPRVAQEQKPDDGKQKPKLSSPKPLTIDDLDQSRIYRTEIPRKSRVGWIQDLSFRGGAEISNELLIRVGQQNGFEIILITPEMSIEHIGLSISLSDLLIINNIMTFKPAQMDAIKNAIFKKGKPYIKYEHDLRELGRPEFSKELFSKSILNFFISPVHLRLHKQVLGADGICLPLAIDTEMFKPVPSNKRQPNSALVCSAVKSRENNVLQAYIKNHPEMQFTIISNGVLGIDGNNVTQVPMVPYEQMPGLYSKFEYLVHMPDGWGAGERVIFEAALCGCKIIANEKSGHMSWGKDLADVDSLRKWLKDGPRQFWSEVEKKVTKNLKIVAIIPTYKRVEPTIAVIENLKLQTIPLSDIVVVGSCEEDKQIATRTGVQYIDYNNKPLTLKIQAGINRARELNPDAILLCGSDDWLSANWIEKLSPFFSEYDLVGSGLVHFLKFLPDDSIEVAQIPVYKGAEREGEPIGAGRIISRRILDRVDWNIFRESRNSGCDYISFNLLKSAGAKTLCHTGDDIKLLCPKGIWNQLNRYEVYRKTLGTKVISNPIGWIENNFPGVLVRLQSIAGFSPERYSYRISDEKWLEKFPELEKWRAANPRADDIGDPIYKAVLSDLDISPGSKILDVGCGSGATKACLPPGIEYSGIDPFPKSTSLEIREGVAEAIPFEDKTFDYVICLASLFHFKDLKLSFTEMRRVLKLGGWLVIQIIIRKNEEKPSPSQTFRITHGIMETLGSYASLQFVDKRYVEPINSWLYRWKRV